MLALIPALTLAVSLVNEVVSRLLAPAHFAQARFQEWHPICLPDHGRRTVLDRQRSRRDIADPANWSCTILRNADPHLSFALLSDFADAQQEEMPEDAVLVRLAQTRIEELNAQYPAQPFYLFHRRRQWNILPGHLDGLGA